MNVHKGRLHLLKFCQLELELVRSVLKVPQGNFKAFSPIIWLNLFLQLLQSSFQLIGLFTRLSSSGRRSLMLAFLQIYRQLNKRNIMRSRLTESFARSTSSFSFSSHSFAFRESSSTCFWSCEVLAVRLKTLSCSVWRSCSKFWASSGHLVSVESGRQNACTNSILRPLTSSIRRWDEPSHWPAMKPFSFHFQGLFVIPLSARHCFPEARASVVVLIRVRIPPVAQLWSSKSEIQLSFETTVTHQSPVFLAERSLTPDFHYPLPTFLFYSPSRPPLEQRVVLGQLSVLQESKQKAGVKLRSHCYVEVN